MASFQPTYSGDKGENVQKTPPSHNSSENQTPMITLTLLHPQHSVAVQTWRFEPKSVIRIGRSRNNEVTLYSAVISRHHVEIRRKGKDWEVINLGSNGTFYEGKRISRALVKNGMVIRLASSGPRLQISLDVLSAEGDHPQARGCVPNSARHPKSPAPELNSGEGMTSEKTSQIPVSKENLERVQGSFSSTRGSSQFSEDEFEQAKVTDTDD